MKMQTLRAQPQLNEIIVEDKCVKAYGQNYQKESVKNKVPFENVVALVLGLCVLAFVVLLVLVLCGI